MERKNVLIRTKQDAVSNWTIERVDNDEGQGVLFSIDYPLDFLYADLFVDLEAIPRLLQALDEVVPNIMASYILSKIRKGITRVE